MLVHHRPAMRIELLVVELEPGRVGCVACKNLARAGMGGRMWGETYKVI